MTNIPSLGAGFDYDLNFDHINRQNDSFNLDGFLFISVDHPALEYGGKEGGSSLALYNLYMDD